RRQSSHPRPLRSFPTRRSSDLTARAAKTRVQTQMGNQGHSSNDARLINEYIQSGAIGTVTEVHVWTNRPLSHWPQGIPRPAPLPDRKSTRLNSSHVKISYAVFC